MFSDIKKYKDKKFFNKHLNGNIYTKDKKYNINIILISEISAYDEIYSLGSKDNKYILSILKSKSINKINNISDYNQLILLSTCSNKANYRLVLLCYLN